MEPGLVDSGLDPAAPASASGVSPAAVHAFALQPGFGSAALPDALRSGTPELGAHERGIINGLASYQLRYGQIEEALALLQLSNRLWPEDRQTLRLLTQAFILVEDWVSADLTETAYRRLSLSARPSRLDRLREAFIHFGRARLEQARLALDVLLCANKGAKSS